MLNIEAIIYDYMKKTEEYRETLGILPTDDINILINIILNPKTKEEAKFSQQALNFVDRNTNFITELFKNNPNHTIKLNEAIAEILYGDTDDLVEVKRSRKELRKELPNVDEEIIKAIVKSKLLKSLTKPKSEEDAFICQNYRNYLFELVRFTKAKSKYIESLENGQTIIDKLKKDNINHNLLEILIDPQTSDELNFCNSYFKLQNNLQLVKENAKNGVSKTTSVEDLARMVAPNLFNRTRTLEILNNKDIADLLYSMTALAEKDYEDFVRLLGEKHPTKPMMVVNVMFHAYKNYLETVITENINRNNQDNNYELNRFCEIEREFSKLAKNGNVYKPEGSTKPKQNRKLPSWLPR